MDNQKLGVSVIIPCYKRIEQTVETIKKIYDSNGFDKEYDAEVIITDSTEDDSLKKVLEEKFGSRENFSYHNPGKKGISINKNAGAKRAEHPLLIFCDSDMEVEKNTIPETIKTFQKDKRISALMTNVIWKGGELEGKYDRPKDEDRFIEDKGTSFVEYIYSRYTATYKEVFEDVGGYDEKVFNMRGEGSDLSTRYWRAGYPLAYNGNLNVYHMAEAPDSIALRIPNPEWGVAKDIFLLAYKFGNFESEGHYFPANLGRIFAKHGEKGHFRMLQGICKYFDFVTESKKIIDEQKTEMKCEYDFKFQEIFSDKEKVLHCIESAEQKLSKIHSRIFKE